MSHPHHPSHPHGSGHPGGHPQHPHGGKQPPNWEEMYQRPVESLPWFYPGLEPEIVEALEGLPRGFSILDIGAGPGTQAIELAKLGYSVTATDISVTAVEKAKERATAEGVQVNFIADNILESKLVQANQRFDVILDRGCFHSISPAARRKYRDNINELLKPEGIVLLKCFSVKEEGPSGGHRFTPEQLKEVFEDTFGIQSLYDTVFLSTGEYNPKALFILMKKKV